MNGQYGKFVIDYHLMDVDPKAVRKVMGSVIILEANSGPNDIAVHYIAHGDQFRKIEEGQIIPEYAVCIDNDYNVNFVELSFNYENLCNTIQI